MMSVACSTGTISTHTLRGERDSTYCICEVTPPQQSGHFTKNHFKKRYFLHNMYYFFSEPPYKTNITARSLTKSNCPQDHMFPLHLYAPLSSSNYYPNNRIEGYLVIHKSNTKVTIKITRMFRKKHQQQTQNFALFVRN